MIVWIASYPKSGNTWIRSLLSSYIYSNDGIFNFDLLKNIKQFPSKEFLEPFLKNFSDIKEVSNFWIPAQNKINLINNMIFLKTHSALCTLENNPFTNKNNTQAIIYVVRDPRNLITSLSHHYSKSEEESFDFINNKNKMIMHDEWGGDDFGIATALGNWADHYNSWKNNNIAPIIIIKYEDLLNDTVKTFTYLINFLKKHIDVKLDKEKIEKVVKSCSFDIMVNKEKKEGFFESITKNNKKINFFYLGKKNKWESLLSPKIENKIRKSFSEEMKQLGYINE
jgi:hypothetical protein